MWKKQKNYISVGPFKVPRPTSEDVIELTTKLIGGAIILTVGRLNPTARASGKTLNKLSQKARSIR